MLKKIDTYLLETMPLLWHSKIHYLLLTTAVLWLLAFTCGYAGWDMQHMTEDAIGRYYESSSFVVAHSLFMILTFLIWALAYFKKQSTETPLSDFKLVSR